MSIENLCHSCNGAGCEDCDYEGMVDSSSFVPKTKIKKFKEFTKETVVDSRQEIKNKRKEKDKTKYGE